MAPPLALLSAVPTAGQKKIAVGSTSNVKSLNSRGSWKVWEVFFFQAGPYDGEAGRMVLGPGSRSFFVGFDLYHPRRAGNPRARARPHGPDRGGAGPRGCRLPGTAYWAKTSPCLSSAAWLPLPPIAPPPVLFPIPNFRFFRPLSLVNSQVLCISPPGLCPLALFSGFPADQFQGRAWGLGRTGCLSPGCACVPCPPGVGHRRGGVPGPTKNPRSPQGPPGPVRVKNPNTRSPLRTGGGVGAPPDAPWD